MSNGILSEDHVHYEPIMSMCYSCSLESEPQITSSQCNTFSTKVKELSSFHCDVLDLLYSWPGLGQVKWTSQRRVHLTSPRPGQLYSKSNTSL